MATIIEVPKPLTMADFKGRVDLAGERRMSLTRDPPSSKVIRPISLQPLKARIRSTHSSSSGQNWTN